MKVIPAIPAIIAQREGGEYFLVETEADRGRIWDRDSDTIYPQQFVGAIAKFGYRESYDGDEDAPSRPTRSRNSR